MSGHVEFVKASAENVAWTNREVSFFPRITKAMS